MSQSDDRRDVGNMSKEIKSAEIKEGGHILICSEPCGVSCYHNKIHTKNICRIANTISSRCDCCREATTEEMLEI
jgi:hypothetical protein